MQWKRKFTLILGEYIPPPKPLSIHMYFDEFWQLWTLFLYCM